MADVDEHFVEADEHSHSDSDHSHSHDHSHGDDHDKEDSHDHGHGDSHGDSHGKGEEDKDPTHDHKRHKHGHAHGHKHDSEVSSVGITLAGEMDMNLLNQWLGKLLQEKGADIYRSKGILAIKDSPDKWVFQAVHMMMGMSNSSEGVGKPWADGEERINKMVFIGKKLDRKELNEGFAACVAN